MSAKLLFRWRDELGSERGPSSTTRAVLLWLSLDADADGASCYPSVRRLERRTGLSRRVVCLHLRLAEEKGWIERSARGDGQGWRRMSYTLLVPTDVVTESNHDDAVGGDREYPRQAIKLVTESNHVERERGDSRARRGDSNDQNVVTQSHLTTVVTSPKTSLTCDASHEGREKRNNLPSLAKLPRDGRNRVYPSEFEGAFHALPARVRPHAKAAAYQAWRVQVQEAEEAFQLEAAADAYAEDCRAKGSEGTEFVMLASTFFGPGERWRPYSGIEPTPAPPAPRHAPGGGFYAA